MVLVKSWLKGKLEDIDNSCRDAVLQQQLEMRSRLGPEFVIFDIDFSSTVRIANDRLTVRSQGSFNTIKANVCVFGGRWMYEVIVLVLVVFVMIGLVWLVSADTRHKNQWPFLVSFDLSGCVGVCVCEWGGLWNRWMKKHACCGRPPSPCGMHTMLVWDVNKTIKTTFTFFVVFLFLLLFLVMNFTSVFIFFYRLQVQLHTKGVMQVGWCSKKCVFNENSGVGDSKLSYGYDGSKQQSWHISTAKYVTMWPIDRRMRMWWWFKKLAKWQGHVNLPKKLYRFFRTITGGAGKIIWYWQKDTKGDLENWLEKCYNINLKSFPGERDR